MATVFRTWLLANMSYASTFHPRSLAHWRSVCGRGLGRFSLFDWLTELMIQHWTQLLIASHLTVVVWTLFLLFVVYVLMSVVIQPSWLPNPIKVILLSVLNLDQHDRHRSILNIGGQIIRREGLGTLSPEAEKIVRNVQWISSDYWHIGYSVKNKNIGGQNNIMFAPAFLLGWLSGFP